MDVESAMQSAAVKVVNKTTTPINTDKVHTEGGLMDTNSLMNSFFGLDETNIDEKTNQKLSEIYNWVSRRTDDEMDIVSILKDIRFKLAVPRFDKTSIDHFHKYVKLRSTAEDSEQQAKAMER